MHIYIYTHITLTYTYICTYNRKGACYYLRLSSLVARVTVENRPSAANIQALFTKPLRSSPSGGELSFSSVSCPPSLLASPQVLHSESGSVVLRSCSPSQAFSSRMALGSKTPGYRRVPRFPLCGTVKGGHEQQLLKAPQPLWPGRPCGGGSPRGCRAVVLRMDFHPS